MSSAAIHLSPKPPSLALPERHQTNQIVKTIALQALVEVAASFSLAALLTIAFTPSVPFFFTAAVVQLAVNTVFRLARGYCSLKNHELPAKLISWTEIVFFTFFTSIHAQTYLHESGHALAARTVFKGANPTIYFHSPSSFGAAYTWYRSEELSWLGAKLGKEKALAFVAMAGPILSLSISAVLLTVGIACYKKYPQLSKYLIAAAICDFVFHAYYAFTALFWSRRDLAHDFVRLFSMGIHPLVATISILAIPILIAAALSHKKN